MTILTLPLSTFGFVLILTALLGAPVPFTDTADTIATIALAFHLALLVALVPAHVLGSDTALWDTVFLPAAAAPSLAQDKKTVVRATKEPWHAVVFYPAAGALLGALLASFGLALDWGRPWQIWPLPPLLGSSAGLVLGNWLGIYAWAKGAWTARVSSLS
ncbi:unnamed protein product [Tilletia laevis]|nr:unnamed protein product [Tilletia laevis]